MTQATGGKLEALAAKWDAERAHTYASENEDYYCGADDARARCSHELRELAAIIASELAAAREDEVRCGMLRKL